MSIPKELEIRTRDISGPPTVVHEDATRGHIPSPYPSNITHDDLTEMNFNQGTPMNMNADVNIKPHIE